MNQPGGFSPGVAARLRLSNGRRVFLNSVSAERNQDSPDIHRREASVLAKLPPGAPAPRLLWSDEFDGWVTLAIEDFACRTPSLPWRLPELERVFDALGDLSRRFTPAPFDAPTFVARHFAEFRNWRLAREVPGARSSLPPGRDGWAVSHLDRLAELEARWEPGDRGTTLLHSDLRADNVLLTRDRVVFVDWPGACVGPP